jgi:hypothetical protein
MNKEQKESLEAVIDYFIDDEEKHYEESGKPDNHIYKDILVLKELLRENK